MRVVAACAVLLLGAPARGDEAPADVSAAAPAAAPSLAIPPWILATGTVRLDATAELEVSADKVAKPFALAPDLWFGVADALTLGIVESKFAQTGFRGAAGSAFCITGTTAGCPSVYNNAGLEAWGAVLRGPTSIAIGGGPYAVNLDRSFYDMKLGLKVRVRGGALSVTTMPSVFLAMSGRDAMKPANQDVLYLPVAFGVHPTEHVTFAIGTGIKGALADFAHQWSIPLGVSAAVNAGPIGIGAAFTFGSLWSGLPAPPPGMPPVDGTDLRVVQMWVSYTGNRSLPRRLPPEPANTATESQRPVPVKHVAPPVHHAAAHAREPEPKHEPEAAREPEPKHEPEPAFGRGPEGDRIPPDAVAAQAHQHAAELAGCVVSPELDGEVSITFEVNAKGHVTKSNVESTIHDIATSDCLLGVVRGWEFAPPPHGTATGVYTVSYRSH